jgi:hypothetical protein
MLVVLGRLEWHNLSQGVILIPITTISHPLFDDFSRNNNIALVRIPAVTLSSKYQS